MKRTTVYLILGIALAAGLALGYGGARLFGSGGGGKVHNANLQVGDKAPDFRLRDHTGRIVRLSNYLGKKNVVIAFLPGAFTPI